MDGAAVGHDRPSEELTGRFLVDEEVLAEAGVEDFSSYSTVAGEVLLPDFFLD